MSCGKYVNNCEDEIEEANGIKYLASEASEMMPVSEIMAGLREAKRTQRKEENRE